MEDELVLILPRDDNHYYTYEEVDMEAVGIATVATRDEAREAGYTPIGSKVVPR